MNKNLILAEILNKAQEIGDLYKQIETLNDKSDIEVMIRPDRVRIDVSRMTAKNGKLELDTVFSVAKYEDEQIFKSEMYFGENAAPTKCKQYDDLCDFIKAGKEDEEW